MIKGFKLFLEDGAAPVTGTAGIAGAGDNPQRIVPVGKKAQKRIQQEGENDTEKWIRQYALLVRKATPWQT